MTWYEDPAQFVVERPLPEAIHARRGPHGVALVSVYPTGKTTPGWGLEPRDGKPGFMENYRNAVFYARPRIVAAIRRGRPFAMVMRSVNLLAVDIDRHLEDGGHDGFAGARALDLPPTLAQTSKSGAGRHLFYATDDTWDDELGFGRWDDAIGIAPGVDVRVVGCIYRHATQRWNQLGIAPAPDSVVSILETRKAKKIALHQQLSAAAVAAPDDEEALIMHDALLQELNKPIQPGKRNNSLFAIGSQMKQANYPGWEDEIRRRAGEVGLDVDEADKIVSNITKYA